MDRGIPDGERVGVDPSRKLDEALAAFVAHDPSTLSLGKDVRYTENGQVLQPGDGLWATLTDYSGAGHDRRGQPDGVTTPAYRIDFVDAARQEWVYFGGTLETQTPGMLALRVKTEGDHITEIEAVCVREEKPGERGGTMTLFQPALLTPFEADAFTGVDPEFLADGGPTAKGSHDALAAIVDAYFLAIEKNDSRQAAFAAGCRRRDNGIPTTGNATAAPLDPTVPAYRPFALECGEQIDSGFFRRITRVRACRHLAVDRRRGLVLTVALLDQPGTVKRIEVPGIGPVALPTGIKAEDLLQTEGAAQFYVKRYEPNMAVPMTELMVQLTKVEGGRITRIESVARGAPFGMTDGWTQQ
jgi:hypothetical protein